MPIGNRNQRLNGLNPLAYIGDNPYQPPEFVTYRRPPTTNDNKNFNLGTLWLDTSTNTPPTAEDLYMLVSLNGNIATWINFAGTSALESLTGNSGGAVFGDVNDNINVIGDTVTTTITGNPVTNTLTVSVTDNFASTYTTDDANFAVPVAFNLNIFGAGGITTSSAGDTVTITGSAATAASFTTGTGTPTETPGGVAVPVANDLNVLGSHGIITSSTGNDTLNINIDNDITLGDLSVITAGNNALTITSGSITLSGTGVNAAGNITIPNTNAAGSQGVINFGANRFITNFANTTAVGINASNFTHTGIFGAAFGNGVLSNLTTGASNSGFGNGALQAVTTGGNNSCFGYLSGMDIVDGDGNCGFGDGSILNLVSGDNNVAIGSDSLANMVSGNNNIALGDTAGFSYTGAESSNIIVGNLGVVGESNTIRIGTSGAGAGQQNRFFAAGIRGITTGVADAIAVLVDSADQLGTVSSSIRYKQNVQDMAAESDAVMNLRPVTFEYKDHPGIKQYGLIAEEVKEHMPRLVVHDEHGDPLSIKYHELPAILLNEIQKLHKRIEILEKKNNTYES